MLSLLALLLVLSVGLLGISVHAKKQRHYIFFHDPPASMLQNGANWREPGFWRPKWLMVRNFDHSVPYPKIVSLRLNSDKSLRIYSSKTRPLVNFFKKKSKEEKIFNAVSSLEGKERKEDPTSKKNERIVEEILNDIEKNTDGAWSWTDVDPIVQGKVSIETVEERKKSWLSTLLSRLHPRELEDEDPGVKLRHDIRCNWGTLDVYAPLFHQGTIFEYVPSKAGVMTQRPIGTFHIRVTPHRPMVTKDCCMFQ